MKWDERHWKTLYKKIDFYTLFHSLIIKVYILKKYVIHTLYKIGKSVIKFTFCSSMNRIE